MLDKRKILLVVLGMISALIIIEAGLFCASFFAKAKQENRAIDRGQAHALKILCLGDSFTYGIGADFRESYPAQLESILQNKLSRDVMVINGGVSSANSAIILDKLKSFLKRIDPDIIIIMAGRNDSWNYKQCNHSPNRIIKLKSFFSQSRLYNLLSISYIKLKQALYAKKVQNTDGRKKERQSPVEFDQLLLSKANKLRAAKLLEEALSIYKVILKKHPVHELTLLEMGRCYKLTGQENKAIALFMDVLLINGNNVQALEELDTIFIKSQKLKQQREFFSNISLILSDNEEVKKRLVASNIKVADSYYWDNDFDNVLLYYDKALDIDPYNEQIYNRVYYNKAMELEQESLEGLSEKLADGLDESIKQITYNNIVQAAKICEQAGVILMLSGYPENIYEPVNIVAKEREITYIDHRKDFADNLVVNKRSKYFINDGHCTKEGYLLIAKNISKAILGYLKAQ